MRGAAGGHARRRVAALLATGSVLLTGGALSPGAAEAMVPNPDPTLISRWQPCEPDTGVTVIVDFQDLADHKIQVGCALGEPASGTVALMEAGFTVTPTVKFPSFVCRLDEQPAEQACLVPPPGSEYWAYYHAQPGGQWVYSGVGASDYVPPIGSVEGWGFSRHLQPGGPDIRLPAQDGAGAILEPSMSPSSAIQLRLAREWLVRRLEALAPAGGGAAPNAAGEVVSYAAALARSGYPLTGARLRGAREFLADPATAKEYSYFLGQTTEPLPGHMGPYAIALGALEGGPPLLADGTSLRVWLLEDIDAATGKVKERTSWKEDGNVGGFVLEALARTGPLPAKVTALIEMIERSQEPDGSFGEVVQFNQAAARGLQAADQFGGRDLSAPLDRLAAWAAGLQEADGGVNSTPGGEAHVNLLTSAAGALIMATGGEAAGAVKAAQWISPLQITAELAGGGPNSTTGGPGSPDVGAFATDIDGLREAVRVGVSSVTGVVESTPAAVEALTVAPWLYPVPARVSSPLATSIGDDHALISGAIETGTSDQSVAVEYGPGAGYGGTAAGPFLVAELGSTPVEIELAGLAPGTAYRYRLVATGPLGEVVAGPEATFVTTGTASRAEPVSPPGGGGDRSRSAFATIRARKGGSKVGKTGVARIAVLSCPAGSVCVVSSPRRVRIRIGGRAYWAKVLVPRRLAGGSSRTLRVRLPKAARAALAGHLATVVVPVTLTDASGKRTVRVRATLSGVTRVG